MSQAARDSKTYDLASDDYLEISENDIASSGILPADVFLKISNTKLILIGRQGAKGVTNLKAISEDSAKSFFVRREDYKNCVGQHLQIAGILMGRNEVPEAQKMELLGRTAVSVFKEIDSVGFTHESLEHAREVSKSVQSVIAAKSDLRSIVEMMEGISDDLLRHSIAVSAVSTIIARTMNWTALATLEKLALGAFLHDVGLKEIPKDILDKPRHEMTFEERQTYETHVLRGAEILSSMPSIRQEIVAIVMEHHENAIGQGYPKRMRDFKMNPLSRLVALADYFCELTFAGPSNPHPKSAPDAVNYIESTLGQPFSKPAFVALKQSLTNIPKVAIRRGA